MAPYDVASNIRQALQRPPTLCAFAAPSCGLAFHARDVAPSPPRARCLRRISAAPPCRSGAS